MKFQNKDTYRRLRLMFDAVDLTVKKGWNEDKIYDFVQKPNWYSEYSWNKKTSDACYKKILKMKLLTKREIPLWDMDVGWEDK
jgi:hypothetical protein